MKTAWWAGAVLLAGCSDEDWLYRPRDSGARMDAVVVVTDGTVGDRGVGSDADVVAMGDVVTMGDVPTAQDARADTDAGPLPTGLTVRAQGMATTSVGSATAGTLRVSETGFEVGERGCVGSLCVVGGLVP